ncbi:hypothetical protein Stsp02_10590 [Streptomyces sp. NBRC 14336]|nr:hypothetical protein Stsp02_10590 [Streptomyces sp. NBRC 14336]
MGATAAEVKALSGFVVTVEWAGKTGRPATVFTLRGDSSGDSAPQPASAEGEQNRGASGHAEVRSTSAARE